MFSRRMDKVEVSGIRKIFEMAAQVKDAVDLSLGQADFDVPEPIKQAAQQAITDGKNRYTVTQGIPELHEAIREYLDTRYQFKPEKLLVTGGTAGALFLSLMVLVNDGDEVLLADPYFICYKHLVNVTGGTPVYVDTSQNNFKLTRAALEAAVTEKSRILIFNNPVNPTGIAYTAEEVKEIVDFCRDHKLILISDEIYDQFSYDWPHASAAGQYENTLMVAGMSKNWGMPGWRLGYAAGMGEVVNKMAMLQQFTFVCAPAPLQHAAITALRTDMSEFIDTYRQKRDLVYEGLKDKFEVVKPGGAFYIFPKAPNGETGTAFVERAIKASVLVVPGVACSTHDTHFRISYAADDEALKRGIDILNSLA